MIFINFCTEKAPKHLAYRCTEVNEFDQTIKTFFPPKKKLKMSLNLKQNNAKNI